MERKTGKTALIVAVIGVAVLLLILLSYYLINGRDNVSQIALPDYTVIPADEPEPEDISPFATVTKDNVLQILESLTLLEAYHSEMTLEYYWEEDSVTRTAEIWSRGTEYRLVQSEAEGEDARQILVRDDGAWIWYEGMEPVAMPDAVFTVADLLGIPDYMSLSQTYKIAEAEYATLAGNEQTTCIYVRWIVSENRSIACWISPGTGLLERAIMEENGNMVYRMQQISAERLLPGDDAYSSRFLLPNEQD